MIHKAEYNGSIIEYTIEKRKRKTICIKIDQNGCVKVITPNNVSMNYVSDIVKRKGSWIISTREKVLNRLDEKVVREVKEGSTFLYLGREYPLHLVYDESLKKIKVSLNDKMEQFVIETNTYDDEKIKKELEKWYREKTMDIVLEKIKMHEDEFNDKVTEVRVKEQKRRWASCTYKNAILFNWRCCMAPEDVVEYIVIHEMCHFDHKNHSKDFWNRVKEIMPDYKEKHEYLRKYGMNFYI
ncbi:MAG: SprT family zinc-dependent metalloprotease [Clostridium sp.]|nr:SprT family zinc-dependent metalloprotease [Clostridium sp.]